MRKSHPLAIACLALLSIATGAIADTPSPWTLAVTRTNKDQIFLNTQTIQKRGAIVTYDTIDRYAVPSRTGVAALGVTYQGHCLQPRTRAMEAASYDASFNVLATGQGDRKWQIVKKGSIDYEILMRACKRR